MVICTSLIENCILLFYIYVTHMKFRGISAISGNGANMTYLVPFGT